MAQCLFRDGKVEKVIDPLRLIHSGESLLTKLYHHLPLERRQNFVLKKTNTYEFCLQTNLNKINPYCYEQIDPLWMKNPENLHNVRTYKQVFQWKNSNSIWINHLHSFTRWNMLFALMSVMLFLIFKFIIAPSYSVHRKHYSL